LQENNLQKKRVPVAIVTGISTGIGFSTSLALAKDGFRTYATMTIAAKENLPLTALQTNVDDDKSVNDTIEKIINESSRCRLRIDWSF